jgi:hypothetical protein
VAYDPKASKYDTDSVGKVRRRMEAERAAAEPSDEEQARSVLDGLPTWLVLDNWRWLPGVQRPAGPRRRPS